MNAGDTVRVIAVIYHLDLFLSSSVQIGIGWVQGAIWNGQRSSSATTYVGPDYITRPNLHILLHAQATKLLEVTDHGSATPCFNGVEFGLSTGSSSELMSPIARIHSFTRHKAKGGR